MTRPAVTYRRQGDDHLLVEFGPMVLDLGAAAAGPRAGGADRGRRARRGGRTDPRHPRACRCSLDPDGADAARGGRRDRAPRGRLPPTHDLAVPSRTVHLPLSWDDPATREAIDRYMAGVRADAPWCPWNIEFIRRDQRARRRRGGAADRLRRRLPGARPRRRLPRRAGGDAARPPPPPGHHQVQPGAHLDGGELGRASAAPTSASTGWRGPAATSSSGARPRSGTAAPTRRPFEPGTPWLLRAFDRIRWFPVEADELLEMRADMAAGTPRRADRGRRVLASPSTRHSSPARPRASLPSARPSRRPSPPSARPGRRAESSPARRIPHDARDRSARRTHCRFVTHRVTKRTEGGRCSLTRRSGSAPRSRRSARRIGRRSGSCCATKRRRSPRRRRSTRASRRARSCRSPALTFAVKDNIDVAGMPTTAGCPAFAYTPEALLSRGRAPPRGRRDPPRQDQPRPVRDRPGRHPLPLRSGPRRPPPRPRLRRLELRLGGRRRPRPRRPRPGDRHRRLRPRPGRLPGHRRREADAGPRPDHRAWCPPAARSIACRSSPRTWDWPSWRWR